MYSLRYLICVVLLTSTSGLKYEEYKRFLDQQSQNATFVKLFDQHLHKFQRKQLKSEQFPCEAFKTENATSVHRLSPSDIQVIGAVGDSITAGTGVEAQTVIGLLTQYRGLSWSVGGDGDANDHITIANIIKRYNPNVVGFSTGTGDYETEDAHLNVAEPGNEARNMPFQARLMINRMKSSSEGVDLENDWKLITMFIGGNDLCNYCTDRDEYTVEKYIGYIREALDMFHNEVPKTFVNLVEVLNIANVPQLNQGIICNSLHYFTCKCAAFPGSEENFQELKDLNIAYQKGVNDLIDSGRYDTKDDFTVVVQPFWSDTNLPQKSDGGVDLSYFAPDCFHLSERGHEAAASALWDNMNQPVGEKNTFWRPGEPVYCPTSDNAYFYTKKNAPAKESLGSENKGFGSMNSGIGSFKQVSNSKPKIDKPDNMSGATVAGVIMGILGMIVLIAATAYYRRQRHPPIEKEHLLHEHQVSYTEI